MESDCCGAEVFFGNICSKCRGICSAIKYDFEIDEEASEFWMLDEEGNRYDAGDDLGDEQQK
jgi:hypothetical protein